MEEIHEQDNENDKDYEGEGNNENTQRHKDNEKSTIVLEPETGKLKSHHNHVKSVNMTLNESHRSPKSSRKAANYTINGSPKISKSVKKAIGRKKSPKGIKKPKKKLSKTNFTRYQGNKVGNQKSQAVRQKKFLFEIYKKGKFD